LFRRQRATRGLRTNHDHTLRATAASKRQINYILDAPFAARDYALGAF
jgi:hypothetical protein